MKLLLDFLPLLLFFVTFKYADGQPDWAAAFATEHLGFLVSGGKVGPTEAPVLLATIVAVRQALDYTSTARAVAVCALGWALAIGIAMALGLFFGPTLS